MCSVEDFEFNLKTSKRFNVGTSLGQKARTVYTKLSGMGSLKPVTLMAEQLTASHKSNKTGSAFAKSQRAVSSVCSTRHLLATVKGEKIEYLP